MSPLHSCSRRPRWRAVGSRACEPSTMRMLSQPLPPGPPTLVQQAVHDYGSLIGNIDLAVHHQRFGEFHHAGQSVARAHLIAVVKLSGKIVSIVGVQGARLGGCMMQHPDDPIGISVRRNYWSAAGKSEGERALAHRRGG